MRTVWRQIAVLLLAVVLACDSVVPAGAQSSDDTGIIRIAVTSVIDGKPLADARVFLLGPNVASALTNKSGIVKYTDVASGLYRVRISRSGFRPSTSAQFELLGEKEVDVNVVLGPSAQDQSATSTASTDADGHTIIGRTSARVSVNTRRRRSKQCGAPHLRFADGRARHRRRRRRDAKFERSRRRAKRSRCTATTNRRPR